MKVVPLPQAGAASEWFARIRSGELDTSSNPEWEAFAAEPHNEVALEQREAAWAMSAELADRPAIAALLADVDRLVADGSAAPAPAPRAAVRRLWPLAAAASVALLATAIVLLQRTRASVENFSTAPGEQRVVTLADQSAVTLNTGSSVRVTYSRGLRRVDLLRGEALFAVAKNPARPFEVHALAGVTTAVGTRFDVRLETDAATVSVLEGAVTVAAAAGSTPVAAGEAVDYGADGRVSAPRPANTARIQGWEAKRIVFSDEPLAQALEDYNRYGASPIVLSDPALGSRHINGVFRIGDEQAFLGALEQGLHLRAEHRDGQTVLELQ
jgi:transmembrane sensor